MSKLNTTQINKSIFFKKGQYTALDIIIWDLLCFQIFDFEVSLVHPGNCWDICPSNCMDEYSVSLQMHGHFYIREYFLSCVCESKISWFGRRLRVGSLV